MCVYRRPHQGFRQRTPQGGCSAGLRLSWRLSSAAPHELPAHGLDAAGVPGEPRGARHAIAFRAPTSESGQKGNNASVISRMQTLAACKRWLPGPSASIRGTPMGHGLPAPITYGAGSPPVSSAFRQRCLRHPSYPPDFFLSYCSDRSRAGGMLAAARKPAPAESLGIGIRGLTLWAEAANRAAAPPSA